VGQGTGREALIFFSTHASLQLFYVGDDQRNPVILSGEKYLKVQERRQQGIQCAHV
jgi:hypothetical protein